MTKAMNQKQAISEIERHFQRLVLFDQGLLESFVRLAAKLSGKNVAAYKLGAVIAHAFQSKTTIEVSYLLNKCDSGMFSSDWCHSAAAGAKDYLKGTTPTRGELFYLVAGNANSRFLAHMLATRGFNEIFGVYGVNPSDF